MKADYDDMEESDYQYQLSVDSERGCVEKCGTNKRVISEMRLELNRQRARDTRNRKKIMMKTMQHELVFLMREKKKLRMENQKQQEEINLLRKDAQLLLSNNKSLTHVSAPQEVLGKSDGFNNISGVDNTHDHLSVLVLAPERSRNLGRTAAFIHSSTLPSLESNNKSLTHVSALPTSHSESNSFNNISGVDNKHDNLSAFLLAPKLLGKSWQDRCLPPL